MATKSKTVKPFKQKENYISDHATYIEDGQKCVTSLGTVYVYNESGNLILQQKIEDFFRHLKARYP